MTIHVGNMCEKTKFTYGGGHAEVIKVEKKTFLKWGILENTPA